MTVSREKRLRFWKACGFTENLGHELWQYEKYKETNHWWIAPDKQRFIDPPPISNLSSLFKYAVPIAQGNDYQIGIMAFDHGGFCISAFNVTNRNFVAVKGDDLADALYRVLCKILEVLDE